MRRRVLRVAGALACLLLSAPGPAPEESQQPKPIPHGQSAPPGDPLSPEEAVARMTVPEGFTVEVVAAEPDLVNPVAMTFDERGRIWVTESLEYPRNEPGEGRDRVKVLEDTDGDGKADKFTIFAEGLNIPSGIAVGHGGVWVANAPDILFFQDTDGDGKADRKEVVVTGFGREDTHELPNSLTWGPDGWLYGWNGVFNPARVEQNGKVFDFTCALFRIHPKTREFQLFAEGTSNPWGVTFDPEGSAFASACVIDHLWHLVETGYYHRQGGPYPPFTWKLESIVDHLHQKAAYCGIHYFDSDAYPAEYRDRLYMGNIHGNCVNADTIRREGSSYRGEPAGDFLSANDAWFMPVAQKTGPDGCLYVLDWYDRYHCYQDARRDPEGIDRLKGRLYRIRYKETPLAKPFDLAGESDDRLIERLGSPNLFFRDLAQRLLAERNGEETRGKLQTLVLDEDAPGKARMHALWALIGGGKLDPTFHAALLAHPDATFRAWGVRAAGNQGAVEPAIRDVIAGLADDPSPDVALQVAIASRKVEGLEPANVLLEVLAAHDDDRVIPAVVWQNLQPTLERGGAAFVERVRGLDAETREAVDPILPRAVERLLARGDAGAELSSALLAAMLDPDAWDMPEAARDAVRRVGDRIGTGELDAPRVEAFGRGIAGVVARLRQSRPEDEVLRDLGLLSARWRDPEGLALCTRAVKDGDLADDRRITALQALIAAKVPDLLATVESLLTQGRATVAFRSGVLANVGRVEDDAVGPLLVKAYAGMEPELRPRAVEVLTQRPAWGRVLVEAVKAGAIPASAVNVNQVRRLQSSKDEALTTAARALWGTVREGRNHRREQVVGQMRTFLRENKGDAEAGRLAFRKVCGQCHKLHGEGEEVGPDITGNGRASFEQLLSNVFDPSLVIGESYQARLVATADGRVLTGLLVEQTPERVVLKGQGGKLEVVRAGEVEEMKVSPTSLMPEDLENQLTPQELLDLFAYLTLDRPPGDPQARRIPGAP